MTLQKNNPRLVKISATAAEDLKNIWEYVAEYNEDTASKLIKEFKSKFIILRDSPLLGREQYTFLLSLRSYIFKSYLIFYLPIDNGVEILRILHSSRDIESIFENFFDSLSDDN